MRVDTAKLRGKIAEKGMTQERLAFAIGIDRSTFSRKMKRGGMCFTIHEMLSMAEKLDLTKNEACEIFLASNSHNCEFRKEGQ